MSQAIPDSAELKRSHFAVMEGDLGEYPGVPEPEGRAPNEKTLSTLYAENPYEDVMAKVVRELGLRCEVICVDTWLGSPEHLLSDHGGERYSSLRLRNGYPQLFYTFLANVVRNGR